jgi:(E)-4-hydroxy-3-methylbut-2-enyl-diphosphate synthase
MISRRRSRKVIVGDVPIGGDAPISVQSMTNTDTRDVRATVEQIHRLERAGCEIVRVAVPDMEAAQALGEIKRAISIPLVADIHFDYKLALKAIEAGVDKLRINPGNIGDESRVKMVVEAAKGKGVPIRIGVNSGSLERDILRKYGHPTPEAMVESALRHVRILEDMGFHDIVISLKASDVLTTVRAYRLIAERCDYPLHLGVTEAGTFFSGTVKSAMGIGALLLDGIGDTIRVSLTADPVEEVRVGYEILKSLGLRERGPNFISCPTCGRCEIDLISIAEEVQRRLSYLTVPITIAIMGCVVNGPGEAKEADVGLAGGKGKGVIFKKGRPIKTVPEERLVDELIREIDQMTLSDFSSRANNRETGTKSVSPSISS